MSDFFKPWSRWVGVVTLVLACAFMGLWFRSRSTNDWFLASRLCGVDILVGSRVAKCELHVTKTLGDHRAWWIRQTFLENPMADLDWTESFRTKPAYIRVGPIHYSAIAIPLTMIAAWLLLWTPQPQKRQTTDQRGTDEILERQGIHHGIK